MRIVDAVKQIRQMDPGIGYYKLWLMSKRMFLCDWVPGRDAFLQVSACTRTSSAALFPHALISFG